MASSESDVRKEPVDEDCFEEHGREADLGARIGKDAAEIGQHCRAIERRRCRRRNAAEGEECRDGYDKSERAEDCEDAAPAEHVTDHARDRGAHEVACQPHGKQPADRDLALTDRDEVADESQRYGKHAPRHQPRHDPHDDEQRESRRYRTDERR